MNKNYIKALKLAQSKKYDPKVVIKLLDKAITEGSGEAMFALGTWYLYGEYFEKSLQKANELFLKATEKCIPEACLNLAISYEEGQDVEKDLYKAFTLYVKGALYDYPDCFEEVGRCYYFGIGVKKDKQLAEIWYEKAKKLGVDTKYESNVVEFKSKKKK